MRACSVVLVLCFFGLVFDFWFEGFKFKGLTYTLVFGLLLIWFFIRTCAVYLDKLGFTVFAGVRQAKDYDRLKQVFSVRNRSRAIFLDVTEPTSIAQAVQEVEKGLNNANIGLIGLVNNAGISIPGPLDALPEAEVRYNMEVNVFGVLRATNAFLPLLRKGSKFPQFPGLQQNIATVVHIGSTMGCMSVPFYGPYSMSKYALEAMADAQRLELGESSGIRVSLMRLGQIQTPIFEKVKDNLRTNMPNMKSLELYQYHLDTLPRIADAITKGAADPLKVAKAVEHALTSCSPHSKYRVGWEAWILPVVWSLIPDKVLDRIIVVLFNLITYFTKPKTS